MKSNSVSFDFGDMVRLYIEQQTKYMTRGEFPHIYTHSGIAYKHGWPEPKDITIEDIAHSLSRICRFTGHVNVPLYSVAQHSFLVSVVCDKEDALEGLLHDASEAYCADLASPLKHALGMEAYSYYEDKAQQTVAQAYNLKFPWPKSVKTADMRLLITEMRDLFDAPSAREWASERACTWPPLDNKIVAWSQQQGEAMFLARFKALTGEK